MEKRRTPRYYFTGLAKVRELGSRTMLGYIADISTGGMQLLAARPTTNKKPRQVVIDFSSPDRKPVSIMGEIRMTWQRDSDSRQLCTGYEFVDIPPAGRLQLFQAASAFRV